MFIVPVSPHPRKDVYGIIFIFIIKKCELVREMNESFPYRSSCMEMGDLGHAMDKHSKLEEDVQWNVWR